MDIASHIIGQPITVSWEADPNFMGAFKANLPGHYRYQQPLLRHFKQDDLPADQRGMFLAGDDVSFTAGWAEGAMQTALNARLGHPAPPRRRDAEGQPRPGRPVRGAEAPGPARLSGGATADPTCGFTYGRVVEDASATPCRSS